jgi:type II secretory pathway component PulM
MSDREKKLVLLFGLAAFVLLNVFGISWYKKYKLDLVKKLGKAESAVAEADAYAARYEEVGEEVTWLQEHTPEAKAGQTVQAQLQQFASTEATKNTLTVKRPKILPNDETGPHFHRARVEFNVTGTEASLYRWLDKLQSPEQLRAITGMRLSPDTKDDTLIECTVTVEQWYVPQGATDDPAEAAEPVEQ